MIGTEYILKSQIGDTVSSRQAIIQEVVAGFSYVCPYFCPSVCPWLIDSLCTYVGQWNVCMPYAQRVNINNTSQHTRENSYDTDGPQCDGRK